MNTSSTELSSRPDAASPAWWRVGMVWLVLGGPALVVVAGLITAAIAVHGAEEVLTRPTTELKAEDAALLPAVQGRNHAVTPRR